MTPRFLRARAALDYLLARDPTLLVLAFAMFALLSGVSLALPGHAFEQSPVYGIIRKLGLPEDLTGAMMIVNAAALCLALTRQAGIVYRSLIGLVTGVFWTIWGVLQVFGAAESHFFSAGGSWTFVAAITVSLSTASWARHMRPESE